MTHASQPGIDLLTAYLLDLTAAYPDGEDAGGADQLKLCIKLFRHALRTRGRKERVSLECLETFTTCLRMAGTLLESLLEDEAAAFAGWTPGDQVTNEQQRLALILGWTLAELDAIIRTEQARYSEHHHEFSMEWGSYLRMKSDATEALYA